MATLKLAGIEREKRPELFSIELTDGSEVTFADPKKMHFTALTDLDEMPPQRQIETLTGSGWDKLKADPEMDGEALEWVMGAWRDHYGIGEQGSPRNSSGS